MNMDSPVRDSASVPMRFVPLLFLVLNVSACSNTTAKITIALKGGVVYSDRTPRGAAWGFAGDRLAVHCDPASVGSKVCEPYPTTEACARIVGLASCCPSKPRGELIVVNGPNRESFDIRSVRVLRNQVSISAEKGDGRVLLEVSGPPIAFEDALRLAGPL